MDTPYDTTLPPHLRSLKEEIEGYARGYGLDFYETIFEVMTLSASVYAELIFVPPDSRVW